MAAPGIGITQQYAFTVTLKPHLYDDPAETQYDKTYEVLKVMLRKISHQFTLVAELTKNANLHYHGIITFENRSKNIVKYWYDQFKSIVKAYKKLHPYGDKGILFGFTNIKPITEYSVWIEYISKDIKLTNESLGRLPIIIDDFNCFPTGLFQTYGISELPPPAAN